VYSSKNAPYFTVRQYCSGAVITSPQFWKAVLLIILNNAIPRYREPGHSFNAPRKMPTSGGALVGILWGDSEVVYAAG
jgi:hypothetical protein